MWYATSEVQKGYAVKETSKITIFLQVKGIDIYVWRQELSRYNVWIWWLQKSIYNEKVFWQKLSNKCYEVNEAQKSYVVSDQENWCAVTQTSI